MSSPTSNDCIFISKSVSMCKRFGHIFTNQAPWTICSKCEASQKKAEENKAKNAKVKSYIDNLIKFIAVDKSQLETLDEFEKDMVLYQNIKQRLTLNVKYEKLKI